MREGRPVTANISAFELLWTLLAAAGMIGGGLAVWTAIVDASTAFKPPLDPRTGQPLLSTMEEKAIGAWLAVKWTAISACHALNLVIGVAAMTTPPPVEEVRARNALVIGVCLVLVEIILVGVTIGHMYTRWLVLKLQHSADEGEHKG
jgi:hypothetical protein